MNNYSFIRTLIETICLTLFPQPDISYSDIGGLDTQKQEVREAVELPLTHYELYKQIGMFFCSKIAVCGILYALISTTF